MPGQPITFSYGSTALYYGYVILETDPAGYIVATAGGDPAIRQLST